MADELVIEQGNIALTVVLRTLASAGKGFCLAWDML